jgi:glucokinase
MTRWPDPARAERAVPAEGGRYNLRVLLAGDVGGTKTLLGLFQPGEERPRAVEVGEFATLDYDSLESIVAEFLSAQRVEARALIACCFGVAGAVTEQVARLTNVPWLVDAAAIQERGRLRRVSVINDLEALAYGVTVLAPDEMRVLQVGVPVPTGNAAVIAAGTGLGEAMLHNVGGRFVPAASEGGHADWSPRTPREFALAEALIKIFGRVSCEHVISGPGIVNIYQFTHAAFSTAPGIRPSSTAPARLCEGVGQVDDPEELPARISRAAYERRCDRCVEALQIFVDAYGAEAGNIALRSVATAGVYIGGGIAPKLLPLLETGAFLDAFRAKEPMGDLIATIPVSVILNSDAGLLGAAVHAQTLSG